MSIFSNINTHQPDEPFFSAFRCITSRKLRITDQNDTWCKRKPDRISIGVIMKGKIRLGEFIEDVKKELIEAQDTTGAPFLELEEVQLEVCFVLDASAKAGGNCLLLRLEGKPRPSKPTRFHWLYVLYPGRQLRLRKQNWPLQQQKQRAKPFAEDLFTEDLSTDNAWVNSASIDLLIWARLELTMPGIARLFSAECKIWATLSGRKSSWKEPERPLWFFSAINLSNKILQSRQMKDLRCKDEAGSIFSGKLENFSNWMIGPWMGKTVRILEQGHMWRLSRNRISAPENWPKERFWIF